jgi:hypothetical protein
MHIRTSGFVLTLFDPPCPRNSLRDERRLEMDSLLTVVAPIAAIGALYVVVPVMTEAYRRFRGVKAVTCPDADWPAAIELDVGHAAVSMALGPPDLRVMRCSRWPERHYCDQACVEQVE